jgi:hypothetical protein
MEQNTGMNLTRAAYLGRQGIKLTIIGLVSLMVGRMVFSAGYAYWKATHPSAPPPPTVGFGKLPPLHFPAQTSEDKPSAYDLQLPVSRFPKVSDRAKVFLMTKSRLSLVADEKAGKLAQAYGFLFKPAILDESTYRWTKSSPLQATLEMDIRSYNFSLTTNYLSRADLLSQKNLPNQNTAVNLVKSFITSGQELPQDIATPSGEVVYLKALGDSLSPAVSLSDADYVQVDINRAAIDNTKPVLSPEGKKGVIHAVLSGSLSGRDQIVNLEYKYHPVDYTERHTYPIRTPTQAWQVLQAGEGYIATKGSGETAVIRNVYLGYYDDFDEQEYLQPIYVFEGDNEFMGYVPAIDPRWIQSTATDEDTPSAQ